MPGSAERMVEVQRQFIVAMRNIFITGMRTFVVMQDQGEKLFRMMVDKGVSATQAHRKIADDWVNNLKKAQAEFKRVVEEGFERAQRRFTKPDNE